MELQKRHLVEYKRCGSNIPSEKSVNRRLKCQKYVIAPTVRDSYYPQRETILDNLLSHSRTYAPVGSVDHNVEYSPIPVHRSQRDSKPP